MNIEFLKLNNDVKLESSKKKLLSDMMSLKEKLEQEIQKIESGEKITNPLGIIGERGNTIDNLMGQISAMQEIKEMLDNQ